MTRKKPPKFIQGPGSDDLSDWQAYTKSVKKTTKEDLYQAPVTYERPDVQDYGDNPGFWDEMRGHYKSFANEGLDPKVLKNLRRGKYKIEDRLDLHGFTLDAAHQTFIKFIDLAFYRGYRCVLVITGRTFLSPNQERTIKHNIHDWVKHLKAEGKILATSMAMVQDGGEGALYVLLRRKR